MKSIPRQALCAGTFDPPTLGHLNIIERGLNVFDKLVVAVAPSLNKNPLLSVQDRVVLLQKILFKKTNIEITTFEGLLIEFAKKRKIFTLLRGIRNMSDYEFEYQMSLANKTLCPKIETLFMMTEGEYSHLSSTLIRDIIKQGGSCKGMIHPLVEKKLHEIL